MAELLGTFAVYAFAVSAWLSPQQVLANDALNLLVLAFILDLPRVISVITRWPLAWMTVLALVYLELRTSIAVSHDPNLSSIHERDAHRLSYLLYFPMVAWFLGGRQGRILVAMGLGLVGFLIGRITHFSLPTPATLDFWRGQDPMGIPTAIPLALYAATATVGLVVFQPRIRARFAARLSRWLAALAWSVLFLSMGTIVMIAQSRAVFVSVLLVVVGGLLSRPKLLLRGRVLLRAGLILAALGGLAVGLCHIYPCGNLRLFQELDTYASLVRGDWEAILVVPEYAAVRPVALRLQLVHYGLETWLQRPFFGWGPGATQPLLALHPNTAFHLFNDMHNGYLEILLRLGVVGAGLFFVLAAISFVTAFRAFRERVLDRDVFTFLAMAVSLGLLVNLSNFRMLNWDERYYWILFWGAMAAFSFAPPHPKRFALETMLMRAVLRAQQFWGSRRTATRSSGRVAMPARGASRERYT